MSACDDLSDRMPDVARGAAAWTPAQAAHLAACGECAAEFALVRQAAGLGTGLRSGRDAEAIASSVLGRVREATAADRARRARTVRWGVAVALAASLALVVLVRRPPEAGTPPVATLPGAAPLALPLAEAESADEAQLEAALDAIQGPLAGSSTLDAPHAGDLDTQQLERVLRAWEG